MTRILVTGREGQLVRSLIERSGMQPNGHDLIAVGRPELNLEDPDSIRLTVRDAAPDIIINAAAYTNVDQAEDEPARAQRINGDAAGEVAAAAQATGAVVIQLSTDYVFDGTGDGAYDEDAPTAPIGVYGRTKLDGEACVRENPDHVIVRTAWVYSPFGRNFVRTMMTLARTRDELGVVADQRGNPTSALDLADGLLALCDAISQGDRTAIGRTYHLAGTGEASWHDFAAHVFARCAALGLPSARANPVSTADYPTKAARPANSRLDCARFARDVGFVMPDWRASVDAVVSRIAAEG